MAFISYSKAIFRLRNTLLWLNQYKFNRWVSANRFWLHPPSSQFDFEFGEIDLIYFSWFEFIVKLSPILIELSIFRDDKCFFDDKLNLFDGLSCNCDLIFSGDPHAPAFAPSLFRSFPKNFFDNSSFAPNVYLYEFSICL